MKRNLLWRTNLFVCFIIVLGFAMTSFVSYHSSRMMFEKDVERVSALTSESISHQIDAIFANPVNTSIAMAHDSLLMEFLAGEEEHVEDEEFIQTMREYLKGYREKYGYDSVFLVSANTGRYYHFNGLDRVLAEDDPENVWYYEFLESDEEYSLNIDNDEAASDEITTFINCKINDTGGQTLGVVGVGFRVGTLQELLRYYEENYDVKAYLVDRQGMIEISTDQTGYQASNLFESCDYPQLKDEILNAGAGMGDSWSYDSDTQNFWYHGADVDGYLVTKYVESLEWFLIIDHDTSMLANQQTRQLALLIFVVILVVALVLVTITGIIRKYNSRIVKMTVEWEQEHQSVFKKATEQLYENIYELDITHNCAASEETEKYFESLGASRGTPFDESLQIIAKQQIKEEYRKGYIDTFSPEHVLEAYKNGTENLRYDFLISTDGVNYYWMRIMAHIYTWQADGSVRMMVYRQNIDEEKRREQYLFEKMQRDSLTGLLNQTATRENVRSLLLKMPEKLFAFYIFDLDNFKGVNDSFGHAVGDRVLVEFARILKAQFGEGEIVGRIGGDEFVAFQPLEENRAAEKKAVSLTEALHFTIKTEEGPCEITVSIGVAVAPQEGTDFETLYRNADTALYRIKKSGKGGFAVYFAEK